MNKGKLSVNKGKRFERWLANYLSGYFKDELFSNGIARGANQSRGGAEEPDVRFPLLWIEAKRHKKCKPTHALRQAIKDTDGRIPVAVCRDDLATAVVPTEYVCLRLSDFVKLITPYMKEKMVKENS